jgi:hypothetical protein
MAAVVRRTAGEKQVIPDERQLREKRGIFPAEVLDVPFGVRRPFAIGASLTLQERKLFTDFLLMCFHFGKVVPAMKSMLVQAKACGRGHGGSVQFMHDRPLPLRPASS